MTNSDGNNQGIDWDGELTALMESSGIDPAQLTRPNLTRRAGRWIIKARAAIGAVVVTIPVMWLVDGSGAPAAATVPLMAWLAGWIGYGIWVSAARPDTATLAYHLKDLATALYRAGSRQVFERSRPARVRWRAARLAQTTA
ncbi:hypothetical protein D7D52_34090 [Nocardia yunnanensis]|uniref:Uncharacterized protein n=1 Tax=Nocardia yunnanensis TaxID=2382165 RepID=A0A386ZKS0_9NOCA|nr:hypothetical protein [Nocardia yunnanensis]AYF78018.1 hypothetical protein D7D52_34090 [Nocardia yunnanensis]